MRLPSRALITMLLGIVLLVVASAAGLGTLPQVAGFVLAVIGGAQFARVRFKAHLPLPGGGEASGTVEPGGDVGFDPGAEERENRPPN
jgi:hypothetical protein